MTKDITVKAKELSSLNYNIIFKNLTSEIDQLNYKKIHWNLISNDEVIFSVPKGTCSTGHHILFIMFQGLPPNNLNKIPKNGLVKGAYLSFTAKVIEVISNGENEISIKLLLQQYNEENWLKLINNYKKNQEKTNDISNKIGASKYE